MNNFKLWDDRRGKIISKKGGWRIGSGVESHGYDLINELIGHYSYMQVVVLNATGNMPTREFADWAEAAHICLSWPDARIWCNRIGALGGSSRCSIVAAVSSGVMGQDSRAYGSRTMVDGVKFISNALTTIRKRNLKVEEFIEEEIRKLGGKPHLMGYARPLAKGDERIGALERVTKKLEFNIGPHLSLAYDIERILSSKYDETMNINGYVSAFMSDQGFSADDTFRIFSMVVASGVAACYVDNRENEMGLFSPLRISDVQYEGNPHRTI